MSHVLEHGENDANFHNCRVKSGEIELEDYAQSRQTCAETSQGESDLGERCYLLA